MLHRTHRSIRNHAIACIAILIASAGLAACATNELGGEDALAAPAQMAPIINDTKVFADLDADQLTSVLSPGWNLGNQLEGIKISTDISTGISTTWPSETGYMATKISSELLAAVKAAGFKFVRIPVSYFAFVDDRNGHKINADWLARIQEVVDMCIAQGLYCMINMHGDGYYTIKNSWLLCAEKDQKPILEKYAAIWKQLAETFKDYDESLMFESMNEEFDGAYNGPSDTAYENINAYNDTFVKTIRATGGNNAKRWLLLAGWNTNIDQTIDGFGTTGHFRLPAKDKRLMVSLHYYDPWGFCGGENGTATQWGSFAANPAKANGTEISMAKQFNKLYDAFVRKGIPVVLGEWGSIDKTIDDPASTVYRAYFARKFAENAKRTGAIPVIWDNGWNGKYGFGLFNRGEKADDQGNIVPGTVKVSQQGIIDAIMSVYAPAAASGSKAKVALDKSSLTIQPGDSATLKAKVSGGNAQDKVAWQSTDETVAVVMDGKVVPTGPGYCYIQATLPNGQSAKCDLQVEKVAGVQAKVYLFEGLGWSSVKSTPLFIKAGLEKSYEVKFNASELCLRNIAALYLKDVEVEENHVAVSDLASCPITVESFKINGVAIPLVNNQKVEAMNGKLQFDLPIINEWAAAVEMVNGFQPSGHRDITTVMKDLKLDKETNEVVVRFKTLPVDTATIKAIAPEAAKPVLDPNKTYHAYFGIQAADSWVFRNSFGNSNYGGNSPEFKGGLFDTDGAVSADGHVPGIVSDAAITKADIEAGKTFTVSCSDFSLDDKNVKASALNAAMISTDIPFALVEVTSAKLIFDGKQVNLNLDGKELYAVDIENFNVLVTFINIWQTSLKTFGYKMPQKSISMELTLKMK